MPKPLIPLITALLWAAAITVALAQRALPLLILFYREALTPPQPQLLPGSHPAPLAVDQLARLTARQLQEAAGTRRRLSKATLIEMVLARSAA